VVVVGVVVVVVGVVVVVSVVVGVVAVVVAAVVVEIVSVVVAVVVVVLGAIAGAVVVALVVLGDEVLFVVDVVAVAPFVAGAGPASEPPVVVVVVAGLFAGDGFPLGTVAVPPPEGGRMIGDGRPNRRNSRMPPPTVPRSAAAIAW
jgi:hypothetical protein